MRDWQRKKNKIEKKNKSFIVAIFIQKSLFPDFEQGVHIFILYYAFQIE